MNRSAASAPVGIDDIEVTVPMWNHSQKRNDGLISYVGMESEIILNNDMDILLPKDAEITLYLLRKGRDFTIR
jgi:hypothetical protein